MIDLNEAAEASFDVLKTREANGAVNISTEPWRMLEHMAGEVMEVSNAYSCYLARHGDKVFQNSLAGELADVIICAMCFAVQFDIDIEEAVEAKMRLNERRAQKQGDKL